MASQTRFTRRLLLCRHLPVQVRYTQYERPDCRCQEAVYRAVIIQPQRGGTFHPPTCIESREILVHMSSERVGVSRDEILRLAEMTRIGLHPEEADHLTTEMEAILDHVGRLREVDTSGLSPGEQPLPVRLLRADTTVTSLSSAEVLANAPEQWNGFFVVPAILGD